MEHGASDSNPREEALRPPDVCSPFQNWLQIANLRVIFSPTYLRTPWITPPPDGGRERGVGMGMSDGTHPNGRLCACMK